MTDDIHGLGMHPDEPPSYLTPTIPKPSHSSAATAASCALSGKFADASAGCSTRGISGADLTDCQMWLSAIPTKIYPLNRGSLSIQFQSLSINFASPYRDIMGGPQDTGTSAYNSNNNSAWFESVGGNGGSSGVDIAIPNVRITPTPARRNVNFSGTDPLGWNYFSDLLFASDEVRLLCSIDQ